MIEFRDYHNRELIATSQESGTDAAPQDVLRVDMDSGEIRVMVVHSRTTHVTEQPERTVLWVTQMQATDETE
jgi:hypothetical protein